MMHNIFIKRGSDNLLLDAVPALLAAALAVQKAAKFPLTPS